MISRVVEEKLQRSLGFSLTTVRAWPYWADRRREKAITMLYPKPTDNDHLMFDARAVSGTSITITHTEDERIHIDADGDRYTFDIGSDDEYLFVGRLGSFAIPLMDWD